MRETIKSKYGNEIRRLYIEEKKSCLEIAKLINCHPSYVIYILQKEGIQIRPSGYYLKGIPKSEEHIKKRSETMKNLYAQGKIINPRKGVKLSEETKKKLSLARQGFKPTEETRRKLSLAHQNRVISQETREKLRQLNLGANNPQYGKKITDNQKKIISEANKGKYMSPETRLKISIGNKGKPKSEEAKIKMSEIKKRLIKEGKFMPHSIFKPGKEHPYWEGGKSFELYGLNFNKEFKKLIKQRDNYCCTLCNLMEADAKQLYKRGLAIHHIDYDKLNSFPQNCISLCTRCHALTNHNQNHWKSFCQNLLKEKYGYEYTEDQKIILDFIQKEVCK